MSFSEDPWHLTVIRTQGVLFLRPEKSWRPIVSVTLVDRAHPPYEVVLGTDGQNPNLKMPFVLYDVDEATRLDIRIWHQSGKRRRKRHIVGSAYVRLGELFKRQECPGADVPIHLRCPPPQKRSSKLNNGRSNAVTLTIRMRAPSALLPGSCATSSTSATLVASPAPSVCGDESDACSEDEESVCSVEDIPGTYRAQRAESLM
ncbi:hypothetical protein NM688_g6024 [Phlebia brevispora]|uniref:Uncharacterized protein n=1 Tax=Phlebia brevispora TaxID=194682 RepID=A0ACC1SLC0_9APHY|nr:hypothetical protein NM688_g6024 [Phlebia brevispora]